MDNRKIASKKRNLDRRVSKYSKMQSTVSEKDKFFQSFAEDEPLESADKIKKTRQATDQNFVDDKISEVRRSTAMDDETRNTDTKNEAKDKSASKKAEPQKASTKNSRKAERRPRSKVSKAVFSLILILAIGVFLVSGLKLISIFTTYKKAEDTYVKIAQSASIMDVEKGYPTIDFAALLAQNPDTVGYIYCEDLFEYPIVQGTDNDHYLHTMFDGNYNPSGTLFVDSRLPDGMESRNCVIYGHNMNDGSMFGRLHKFSDKEFYDAHRTFHVYTLEHHYLYKAVAAYTAEVNGFTYTFSFGSDDEFLQFLNQTQMSSWFESDTELTAESKIITLSTCLGSSSDEYRNVLILVRESEITE